MRSPTSDLLGVVVVNFGSHRLLERHLASLVDGDDVQVVVVDNFSSDAERAEVDVLARRHRWSVVHSPNFGFGSGVNRGVERAKQLGCSHFLLLNPDVDVSDAVVEELSRAVVLDPLLMVSPVLVRPDGGRYFAGATWDLGEGGLRSSPTPGPTSWLTAACLAVGGEVWGRTGGFDEDYFLYWEDVDLSRRALVAGARLQVREDLAAVHDEGGTQRVGPSRAKSRGYYFYNCRNRLLFARRHLDRASLRRWVLATPRQSWAILLRGGRRQLLQDPRLGLSAALGSLSGCWLAYRPSPRAARLS